MIPKYAAKRDANEREIIDALEKAGCQVWQVNHAGLPDLYVMRAGKGYWLECKSGRYGKLTKAQQANLERGLRFEIVRCPIEALHAVGIHHEKAV